MFPFRMEQCFDPSNGFATTAARLAWLLALAVCITITLNNQQTCIPVVPHKAVAEVSKIGNL